MSIKQFKYRGVRPTGRIVTGILSAADESDLYAQLGRMDLELSQYKELTQEKPSFLNNLFGARIDTRELIKFFVMMGRLVRTGVPIVNALGKMIDSTENQTLKATLIQVERDLSEGGMKLSESMARFPKVFPTPVVSSIEAQEGAGDFAKAFEHCEEYLKWVDRLKRQVTKALRYPMILFAVIFVVTIVMMAVVVPKIIVSITLMNPGSALPFATRSLMGVSDFFVNFWFHMVAIVVGSISIVTLLRRLSREFQFKTDAIALKLPYFGPLLKSVNTVRFLHTFVILYESGMPLLEGFKISTKNVRNLDLQLAFKQAGFDISNGEQMSQAFAKTGYFAPTTIEMFNVAEDSGRIGEVLNELINFYNQDVDEDIEKVVSLIEPFATMVLGLMIVWIAAGVFGPIYNSFSNLGF